MPTTTLSADYQVTLPQGLCESLLIAPGSLVELSIHDGALRLIPAVKAAPSRSPRPCGLCKGEFTVPDDFNEIDLTGKPIKVADEAKLKANGITVHRPLSDLHPHF